MLLKNRFVTIAAATLAVCLAQTLPANLRAAEPKGKGVELDLDASAAVVLDADKNGMPAKTKLTPTTAFASYSLDPVIDGNKKRKGMAWQEAAWASVEDDAVHGIEIQFGKPMHGGNLQVTWAYDTNNEDNGRWFPSRNYVIQTKSKATDEWKTLVDVKGNQSSISCHQLPEAPFSFLRIYQPSGGGHPDRPNLMWIGQIEVVE